MGRRFLIRNSVALLSNSGTSTLGEIDCLCVKTKLIYLSLSNANAFFCSTGFYSESCLESPNNHIWSETIKTFPFSYFSLHNRSSSRSCEGSWKKSISPFAILSIHFSLCGTNSLALYIFFSSSRRNADPDSSADERKSLIGIYLRRRHREPSKDNGLPPLAIERHCMRAL